MFGFVVFVALGALALAVVVTVGLARRRKRERQHTAMAAAASELFASDTEERAGTSIWGGGEWPRIVVRSHGRLRHVNNPPRQAEVVMMPTTSPWEPPRAS